MRKNILALLLSAVMLAGTFPTAVFSGETGTLNENHPTQDSGTTVDSGGPALTYITHWEWIDPDGHLQDGALAMPGVKADDQASFDIVAAMLPEKISATVSGAAAPEEIKLGGWKSDTFKRGEDGGWPVQGEHTFTAALQEGYALSDGVKPLDVTVRLGGAETYNEISEYGLTVTSSNGSVTYTEGSGFTLAKNGDYEISGIWGGNLTSVNSSNKKAVITVPSGVTANVTLNGVTIINVSGTSYACAFAVAAGGEANITLSGNNTLTSGNDRAGLEVPDGATVTIGGSGKLSATGGESGAGIGGGSRGSGGNRGSGGKITIDGSAQVTATGGNGGAGIGGGYGGDGGEIKISGGTVTATGGESGAGIGGGSGGSGGETITISGGTVTATGGVGGACIGGGKDGASGTIAISGSETVVIAQGGTGVDNIGGGIGGSSVRVTREGGLIIEGDTGKLWSDVTLTRNVEIANGVTVTVESGKTLTIAEDVTLTNNGTLTVETGGILNKFGTIAGNGTNPGEDSYNHKKSTVQLKTSKTNPAYGDTITLTATIAEEAAAPINALPRSSTPARTVIFYRDKDEIGNEEVKVDTVTDEKTAVLTVTLNEPNWTIGRHSITAKYTGSNNHLLPSVSEAITLTIKYSRKAPAAPTVKSDTTDTTVTLDTVSDQKYAYTTNTTPPSIGEGSWKTASGSTLEFSDLIPNTDYYFWTYIPGDESYYDSPVSAASEKITTDKSADQKAVEAAKSAIEGGAYTVAQADAGNEAALKTVLAQRINALENVKSVTASITISGFTAATAGNADEPSGANGGFSFTVALSKGTASDSTRSKTGVITATRYISSDATLSSLSVTGTTIKPEFNSATKDYTATVGNTVSSVTISAAPNSSKALVSGDTGMQSLNVGENKFTVVVTAENGDKQEYHITIRREAAPYATPNVKVGYQNETLTGFDLTGSYTVNGQPVTQENGQLAIAPEWFGKTVSIVKKGDDDHKDSAPQSVAIKARPNAPAAKMKIQKTANAITVTNSSAFLGCEFSIDETSWNGSGTFSNLNAGATYKLSVRYKATGENFASESVSRSVTTANTDGSATVKPGDSTSTGDSTITNSGDKITISDGDKTTVITPPVSGDVTVNGDGTVTVPDGSTVQTGNGPEVTLPDGGKVDGSGTITVPDKGTIEVGDNPTIIITPPSGGTVTPNEDGTVTVPGGSTVQIGGGEPTTVPSDGGAVNPSDGSVTPNSHTVTFDSGGGSPVASVSVPHEGTLSKPADPTRNGYVFGGWYKEPACANAWDFATEIVTGSMTLYAKWTVQSGGGSSSSNSSGGNSGSGGGNSGNSGSGGNDSAGGQINGKPPSQPDAPAAGEIAAGKPDANGAVNVTGGQIRNALTKARQAATRQNRGKNGVSVLVKLQNAAKTATLDRAGLNKLIAEGTRSFTLDFGGAVSMTFDQAALREIRRQSTGAVSFSAMKASLSGEALAAVGSRPAFDMTISYRQSGRTIALSNVGSVSVTIAYTPGASEQSGGLYAVYADGGAAHWLTASAYDPSKKAVVFEAQHFSVYGVGYKAAPAFTDTAGHSAGSDIDFAAGRGLLTGTGGAFSPDDAVTRGAFVTALGRLAGIDPKAYSACRFTDVSTDCAPYAEWAASIGIMSGTAEKRFSPDAAVTRAEMAAIMERYAEKSGYHLPAVRGAEAFTDAGQIGAEYQKAVRLMQQAGIMDGKNGRFAPREAVTRAGAAAVLRRFVTRAASPAARG